MAKRQLNNPICPSTFTSLLLTHHPWSQNAELDHLSVGPEQPLSYSALVTHGIVKISVSCQETEAEKQNMEETLITRLTTAL